jgi:hypothetical protein
LKHRVHQTLALPEKQAKLSCVDHNVIPDPTNSTNDRAFPIIRIPSDDESV